MASRLTPALIILCALLTPSCSSAGLGTFKTLHCLYENLQESHLMNSSLPPRKAWLVMKSRPDADNTPLHLKGVSFIFKESPVHFMPFLKENTEDVHCRIESYFTDNTEVIWPGVPRSDSALASWYITIIHTDEVHMSAIFTRTTATPISREESDETHHVVATFMIMTRTPHRYARLKSNVILDCGFKVDHKAEPSITWRYQGKGRKNLKILSYNGPTKTLQYHTKMGLLQEHDIRRGIASLYVNNLALENEGFFTCSVSVGSLYAEQQIHLEIRESPSVSLDVEFLTMEENEEHKFVCEASNYYPLDVNIEWLKEGPHIGLLPTLLSNVIYSSHKYNQDGTFSIAGFFLYTASLQDNGVTFTCRVEHESLSQPIRRRVRLTVVESAGWLWVFLLVLIIILFTIIVVFAVKTFMAERSASKPKPY